jgi:hypothetical protein
VAANLGDILAPDIALLDARGEVSELKRLRGEVAVLILLRHLG